MRQLFLGVRVRPFRFAPLRQPMARNAPSAGVGGSYVRQGLRVTDQGRVDVSADGDVGVDRHRIREVPAAGTLDAIACALPVGVLVLDCELRIARLNEPLTALLRERASDALGRRPSELQDDVGVAIEDLARQVVGDGKERRRLALAQNEPAGRRYWELSGSAVAHGGAVRGVVIVAEDVTDRRRLGELASTDALTGLANHREFHQRLQSEVQRARRHGRALALALVDVDNFKEVNDSFGHQAGDRILVDIADRLAETLRGSDLVARVGGDEFAIVMPETDAAAARAVAERAHARVGRMASNRRYQVTVSVGVSSLEEVPDADALFRAADRALYVAKAEGRNGVRGYTSDAYLLSIERDQQVARTQAAVGVRALARAVDLKDVATRDHSEGVAELAGRLAEVLGWSPQRISLLREAARVHDVGKIGVSDAVLCNPSSLSADEYELVKAHPALGAQIAGEVLSAEQAAWIRGHHERHDGSGYPLGLTGDAIPDGARILAVAEAWDAMTSDRSYQPELSPQDALVECRRCAGSQFSPDVIAALDNPAFVRFARIFANQRVARAANEEKRQAARRSDSCEILQLTCECFTTDCHGEVHAERDELESVRAHPRRFVVLPGHEVLDAERVVLRTERFMVVEKRF